ncbi:MAG: M15 family metallopeptidase [Saprospiraceae bacterium]|nr:M15 family metallopeptidase [Saprospiraceae bacterium]
MKYLIVVVSLGLMLGCTNKNKNNIDGAEPLSESPELKKEHSQSQIDYDVTKWKEIKAEDGVILDIRYATENNFTKKQIYPCGRCFLRPELADRIQRLQKDIQAQYGMSLKLFDCYRPRPAQQKLWDIVPNEDYVTHPDKGSMHNRGLAVDITLVDSSGDELDMGTAYDFFGREAHTDYKGLSKEILKNRTILNKLMDIHGLKGIRTEWWHFSLKTVQAPLDDWEWPCKS